MSKLILKFRQKNTCCTISVLLLLCCNYFFAQEKVIAYNDRLDLGTVPKDTHFDLRGNSLQKQLKGNEINQYVFSAVGNYTIKVVEKKHQPISCNHAHFPKEINLRVSRIKMTFDANRVTFSKPIIKNMETKGTILTIPITIETADRLPAALNKTPISVAGIGSSIVAILDQSIQELPEGTHLLRYALNGIVTQNSYLMFDFVDANGQIQSVSLASPVKN